MRSNPVRVLLVVLLPVLCLAITSAQGQSTKPTESKPAILTAKPAQTSVAPGGEVKVDVLLSEATSVSGYQLKLNIAGGEQGTMALKGIVVDQERADFLFKGQRVINTTAPATGEIVVVRYEGTSDTPVGKQSYLATFTLTASPDAKGTFKVSVNNSEESTLITGHGSAGKTQAAPAAEIRVVGESTKPTGDTRSSGR